MNPSPGPATWPRAALRAAAVAAPLMASALAHVLLVSAALAVGFRAVPRLQPAPLAELIVLARDLLPAETPPAPRVETPRPVTPRPPAVVPPPSPPRVSPPPAPTPPRAVDAPPVRTDEPPPPPPKREEVKVDTAPAPLPPKPEAPPTPSPRVDDAKPLAAAEGPPRRDGGAESRGLHVEAGRSGGSPAVAPATSGEERLGSGRAGSGLSSGGPPSIPGGGGGTGVAALPGGAGGPGGGTGITRSAIPRGGYQVQPVYPASARQAGIQGTSLLRIHVAADGHVTDIVVARSAGHADMDRAAMAAVRQWRFEPGRRGEERVGMWVLLPVEFRIR